jgi:predicted transposase YdaD
MSKPYDAATKRLLELRPTDWVALLGLPAGPVTLVDADLSTVTAAADRMVRVDVPAPAGPYLFHAELESGHGTAQVPARLLGYNVLGTEKFGLPVTSAVFLLRKEANSPLLTGRLSRTGPDGEPYLTFRYRVVRVWRLDPESLLRDGGLATLPLAPIADVPRREVPAVLRRMEARIEAEARDAQEAGELLTASFVLMGLRFERPFIEQVMRGVRGMRESVTYQAILEEGVLRGREEGRGEGELTEARRMIVLAGRRRLGEPSPVVSAALEQIASRERLEALMVRLVEHPDSVETWEELLGGGAPG